MRSGNAPYKKVVFDTSPLIDALAVDLVIREPNFEFLIERVSPLTGFLRSDPRRQRQFMALLDSIEEIVVTSNVVGEMRSERYSKPAEFHAAYWKNCFQFFKRHHIREELVPLADLEKDERIRELVYKIGPTDTGLMVLANRERCALLTNDGHWFNWQYLFPKMEIRPVERELGG